MKIYMIVMSDYNTYEIKRAFKSKSKADYYCKRKNVMLLQEKPTSRIYTVDELEVE